MTYTKKEIIGIKSIGIYVPENVHTSEYIAGKSGIPKDVVEEKFGIRKKHKAGPDEHPSHMAIKAANKALKDFDPKELDLVIYCGSEYKDYYLYNLSAKIQYSIGAVNANAFEIHSLCSAGVLSLKIARDIMLVDPEINNVLVVTASKELDLVDYSNQKSRFMFNFGDGAAAALLVKGYRRNRILETHMITDGSFANDVAVYSIGSAKYYKIQTSKGRYILDVKDPEDMKKRLDPVSGKYFYTVIQKCVEKSGYTIKDIDFLAAIHMKRSIHRYLLESLNLTEENSFYLEDYGHCQSADAFIGLYEASKMGRLKDGDLVVMLGAGTGYTWAATALLWGEQR
ncbi:MAG: 3-oxoacyl-ACP synthase [Firmicutes bacterium]|nr:3-oxoacyl-ACP synthase [Bacillota bacterium]